MASESRRPRDELRSSTREARSDILGFVAAVFGLATVVAGRRVLAGADPGYVGVLKKRALAAGGGNRICLHSLRGSGISAPSAHSLFLQTCTYRAKRIRILIGVKGSGLNALFNAGAAQVALLLIYGLVAACPIAS